MKTSSKALPLVLILFSAHFINAQTMASSTTKINTDDLARLHALNTKFIQNFINMDTVAHGQIIHKDFICIQGSGTIMERDEYMKEWATGYTQSGYKTFGQTDELIRMFGNVALVRSKTPWTKEINGKTVSGYSIYTDTYVKEKGRWWCVQAQITPAKL